jgi:hypothetical protein
MWFRRKDPISKLYHQGRHRQRSLDKICTFPGCGKKRRHRGPHDNKGK